MHVEITGYRDIKFHVAEDFLKSERKKNSQDPIIQFFNAQLIATHQHLYFAVINALSAFKNQSNLSKNLAIETMLYASAQRQIQKAIQLLGLKQDTKTLAAVIIGANPLLISEVAKEISNQFNSEPNETVLEISKEKTVKIREAFRITDAQMKTLSNIDKQQAIVNLVIEQVALLSSQL